MRRAAIVLLFSGAFACEASRGGRVELERVAPRALPVPTATNLPAISGFSVNARIHPHGRPASWTVEYGATTAYGTTTPTRALPGKLAAHFAEDWAGGPNGFQAGFSGVQLATNATGGPDGGPFIRYTEDGTPGNDVNHLDGIGLIHLGPYFYPGNFYWADVPPLYLSGGFPDLRGARFSLWLRGVGWAPHGTSLGTWIQGYRDRSVVEVLPEDSRFPNWANSGNRLDTFLASGEWELAEWVLRDRTADWTFAGANGGRLLYDYGELDGILSGVNVDLFVWQILHVDLNDQPSGAIDSAQLGITYRQHSLCAASNGGALAAEPAGGTGGASLTDGWGGGAERQWQSAANPQAPQIFEYSFERPVSITSVNVHNATQNPSRDLEISVSSDGGASWTVVATGELPTGHALGPNYDFFHVDKWELKNEIAVWAPLHAGTVNRLRVAVLSGYQEARWGLGEIEAFGSGALEQTDEDWYDLNQDIRVVPGTYHFRVRATSDAGGTVGDDQTIVVP